MSSIKPYIALLKSRLSMTVAFSGAFGYLLAPIEHKPLGIFLISLAGFVLTGAANIVNQLKEIELDKLMKRTAQRPLPTETLTPAQARNFGYVLAVIAIGLLSYFTWKAALVGLLSYILYGYVYTPLKRVGPISVFVGAIPGAMPPLLGWTAATGAITYEALIIFGIQFVWQFPHFWAIAWVSDEDYKRAGFKLLPSGGGQDLNTAIQIMIYTLFLLPLGLLPSYFGLVGLNSGIVATVCGVLFLAQTFSLMRDCSRKSALKIMFGSFIYLPVVQIAYLLDKMP